MPRGRPAAPTFIVEPNEVNDLADILLEKWTLMGLGSHMTRTQPLQTMKWLAARRLIRNQMPCNVCNIDCNLTVHNGSLLDGYRWSCRICKKKITIRADSFFAGSHLPLWKIVVIMYCWCRDLPQTEIMHQAGLSENKKTLIYWCSLCRDVCEKWLIQNPQEIGGLDEDWEPVEVEIDTSYFFHGKGRPSEWREGHWVFGGIERKSGKSFMMEVPDSTAPTLNAVVQQFILPGSHIFSDGSSAFENVGAIGGGIYIHEVVNHSENLMDPDDSNIHTRRVENMWNRVKHKFRRQRGTNRHMFPSYLAEFLWRNEIKDSHVFSAFLIAIRQQYSLLKE